MGSSGQHFNLRWNNHTNNILQVFIDHLNTQDLVDVTLSCEGKFLKAHKMVLSACSPYFQELFRIHQVPHQVIIFNSMGFNELKLVVEFMYRGEIKVLENDLQKVLHAAETLQIKGLCTLRNKYDEATAAAVAQTANQQSHLPCNKVKLLTSAAVNSGVPGISTVSNYSNNKDDNICRNDSNRDESTGYENFVEGSTGLTNNSDNNNCAMTSDKTDDGMASVVNSSSPASSLVKVVPTLFVKTNLKRPLSEALGSNKRAKRVLQNHIDRKVFIKENLNSSVIDQLKSVSLLKKKCVSSDINKMDSGKNRKLPTDSDNHADNRDIGEKGSGGGDTNYGVNNNIDDDLPTTIKVEPLDIKDIDGETSFSDDCNSAGPSTSPKLVIDVPPEENENAFRPIKVKKILKPQILSRYAFRGCSSSGGKKQPIKDDSLLAIKYEPSLKRQYAWLRSGKIPRPPNAFMVFANEWRKKLSCQHPLESNKDISVRLGMLWKNLSADDKEVYYKAARKADEDHKKKYPGYYYSPKEARIRKSMKLRERIKAFNNNVNNDVGSFHDGLGQTTPQSPLTCVSDFVLVKDELERYAALGEKYSNLVKIMEDKETVVCPDVEDILDIEDDDDDDDDDDEVRMGEQKEKLKEDKEDIHEDDVIESD